MAYADQGAVDITLEAGADLSADQYKVVALATDGQIDVAAAARGDIVIGVLQNTPSAAGQAATVRVSGVSKVIAGEAVEEGAELCPDGVVAGSVTTADTSADRVFAMALSPAADTEVFSALITNGGFVFP